MKLPVHLFDWPSRHNVHLALPLFLVGSFILHASGVLIFQVFYPRSAAPAFRSAQVYFLRPGSPEAAALAPMLAASDPALFSPVESFGPEALAVPPSKYVPGFAEQAPELAGWPTEDNVSSTSLPPLRWRASEKAVAPPVQPGLPTVVELTGGLEGRKFTPPKDFVFSAPLKQNLEAVQFLVQVSPEGVPLHVLPLSSQASSGIETIDRAALAYLLQSRFEARPDQSEPVWGYARFLWGSDIERRKEP